MRNLLLIVGLLALVIGLVWIGQGTGTFPYPAASFMIARAEWAYVGGILVIIGAVLIWRSRTR